MSGQRLSDSNSSLMGRKSFCGSNSNMNQLFRPEFGSTQSLANHEKVYQLMQSYLPSDKKRYFLKQQQKINNSIQEQIVNHVEFSLARTRFDFEKFHCYQAVSHSIRDRLIESFNDTQLFFHEQDCKRVCYLSLEFLIGRCLQNAVLNLGLKDSYSEALLELGYQLENLYTEEIDPALGNGGLGRLAACFMDSLATLNYPAFGYGIRYSYGIFKQLIQNGYQVETPDYWLDKGWPWEIERLDIQYPVKFYGKVIRRWENGKELAIWEQGETINARAYDIPIPGYMTFNTLALRLWRSLPTNEFDFNLFNEGDYFKSLEARERAEYITSVLYPNDSTYAGKELRLKQQYLLVSATLQDIIRRFKKFKRTWSQFQDKVAIQLNDTHPSLAIIELLRILIDVEGMNHSDAWDIVYNTFGYTNHTVLPEALEKWGVDLLGSLLPRHLEIIYLVNFIFLEKVKSKYPGDEAKLNAMSIVEEGVIKKIRMANLSIIGSHSVNGVARIHSDLLKSDLFKEHYSYRPKKFINITNGVTPRRWLRACNPLLAAFYDNLIGNDTWVLNMDQLKTLDTDDPLTLFEFMKIKRQNKLRLVNWVREVCNVEVNPDSLFDIQVKRIHEYKRQLLNILYVIYRYLLLKDLPLEGRKKYVPRTVFFGGKAAPAYANAKAIIKLINSVSEVLNHDHDTNQLLKVVFLPNYNVSSAEIYIPASDISQHISTAGTEASGTSNMKFVMNGGLIIGTWDGANVEIAEEVGLDNIIIFGARVDDIEPLRKEMRSKEPIDYVGPTLWEVLQTIKNGKFGHEHNQLIDSITNKNDFYLVCHDFYDYATAQLKIDTIYHDKRAWAKKAMLNSIRSAKFSSDRTIHEYAKQIWGIQQVVVPSPSVRQDKIKEK